MMTPIQTNVLNSILDELDIRNIFWENTKVFGAKWHGDSIGQYLRNITPCIAVISAFPPEKQDKISIETFDLLNYKWIAICYSNGWMSDTLAKFDASLFCNAIDVYYGIGKYNNGRWPSLDYNNLITTSTIIDFAIKQKKWDGDLTPENWQSIHGLCLEGIARREKKLAEADQEFMRRRGEILKASLSVIDTDDSEVEEHIKSNDEAELKRKQEEEELKRMAFEEAEKRRLEAEEQGRIEAAKYEERRKMAEFAVRKQTLSSESKKKCDEFRQKIAAILKKVHNTNVTKQTTLCGGFIETLVNTFIELRNEEAWIETLKNRQYGDSLERVVNSDEQTNTSENPSKPSDEKGYNRKRYLGQNEVSYIVDDKRADLRFSKELSEEIIKGKAAYYSIIVNDNGCYIKFYVDEPNDMSYYGNITIYASSVKVSSKMILSKIKIVLGMSGTHFYLTVRRAPEMGDLVYQFVDETK